MSNTNIECDLPEKNDELGPYLAKMANYCAYRERSLAEAIAKLNQMGADNKTTQSVVDWLVANNYLSDVRFADAYVRGHLSKGWGQLKIVHGLRKHQIDQQIINQTIAQHAPETDTYHQLNQLFDKKIKTLKGGLTPQQKAIKLLRFAVGRGFKPSDAKMVLKQILSN